MRKTYRLLTLLVVGLATFSGELFITRANTLTSSIPASCVLVDDNTKTTQLRLLRSHLDQNTRNKLNVVLNADPHGRSSIGLDCRSSSSSSNSSSSSRNSSSRRNSGIEVLYTLSLNDLNDYCKSKGFNNVSQYSDPNSGQVIPNSFLCAPGSDGNVHMISPSSGELTYYEACKSHVSRAGYQVHFDQNQNLWQCVIQT